MNQGTCENTRKVLEQWHYSSRLFDYTRPGTDAVELLDGWLGDVRLLLLLARSPLLCSCVQDWRCGRRRDEVGADLFSVMRFFGQDRSEP